MTFIWPALLLSLLVVPLLGLLYWRLQQRRKKLVASYGNLGMGTTSSAAKLGFRRHIPAIFFLLGLIVLCVGLARPQTVVSLPRIEGTVILAFDVSGSMAADDMAPTRMEAAKSAARDFIDKQPPSVLIGVVAFSDSGFTVQTPTNDANQILTSITRIGPQRGTSLAQGINASLRLLTGPGLPAPLQYSNLDPTAIPTPTPVPAGTYTPSVIILLSDGENNENPNPLEAAQAAADRGVRIYTIGIGSPQGTTLKVNGFTVHTQLDEAMLQQIADISDGTYYNAQTSEDLLKIYDNLDPELVIKPEQMEVTSLFAGASTLLFLLGGLASLFWLGRWP